MESKPNIPVVTFLTDFGYQDGSVGIMKGIILEVNRDIKMVDISHEIPQHDVRSAAFVIGQAYAYFPENTLHIIVVDPGVGTSRNILYVEAGYYKFLVPDNGVLQYVFECERVFRVINVKNQEFLLPEQSSTFHGRDIFAPVAAHIIDGVDPTLLGENIEPKAISLSSKPEIETDMIRGEINYIDHFGNLVSNISHETIIKLLKEKKKFRILLAEQQIDEISETFFSKPPGNLLAYLDSSGYLAFAINGQNAAEKMGISVGDHFEILYSLPD